MAASIEKRYFHRESCIGNPKSEIWSVKQQLTIYIFKTKIDVMDINDRDYKLILPKYSNNGEHFAKRMTKQFGGVTILPSVLGCFAGKEGLICEENVVLSSSRDSESTPNFGDQTKKDESFMGDMMAHSAGTRFGQESIMISESKTEVSFPQGSYSKELPDTRVGIDFFKKMI
jgi:hypothetical protein